MGRDRNKSKIDNAAVAVGFKPEKEKYKKMGRKNGPNIPMNEAIKIQIHLKIDELIAGDDETYEFPSILTNTQRAYIHNYCRMKGLKTRSYGTGDNRRLTVSKTKSDQSGTNFDSFFTLSPKSVQSIHQLLTKFPLSVAGQQPIPLSTKNQYRLSNISVGIFTNHQMSVPPANNCRTFDSFRSKLPIYPYRDEILKTIVENQVIVVCGETGSGKTTQIPQYIMEWCTERREECRIICTQPRRIAAISMATRISEERGVDVGKTVGYQVRLESRITSNSNLIFTTSGYMLRCLVGSDEASLSSATHIIIDEIHERDKFTDFLLISIRDAARMNRYLRVILMSATIDANIFSAYFEGCPILQLPGRMFDVEVRYLDDILLMTGFKPSMAKKKAKNKSEQIVPDVDKVIAAFEGAELKSEPQPFTLDAETIKLLDETIESFRNGDDDAVDQFLYMHHSEQIPIDYEHSTNRLTMLMIASGQGKLSIVQKLIEMGAEVTRKNQLTQLDALEMAIQLNNQDCALLLQENGCRQEPVPILKRIGNYLIESHQEMVGDQIDHSLLYDLIVIIHEEMPDGSILVFLSGYDDICEQYERLSDYNSPTMSVLMLHGQMRSIDQNKVFKREPIGKRKIILSTNIAETSITIDGVVYVIDCGKVKLKTYETITESTALERTWISKACAMQRCGRAGRTRPGQCYRMYSKVRYNAMDEFTVPEILRVPLTEICLNARMLCGWNLDILTYLSKAIQPPNQRSVKRAIVLLKQIGALNEDETITDLGLHLVDLPVDVQLGKAIILSVALKCVDPVLTIVSVLSNKDPFMLPSSTGGDELRLSNRIKHEMAGDFHSDHMIYLTVYQQWNNHRSMGTDRTFCIENNLSGGQMELIHQCRQQILGSMRRCGMIKQGKSVMYDVTKNASNWSLVKACFVGASYPNIARIDRNRKGQMMHGTTNIQPHPKSILSDPIPKRLKQKLIELPSKWIIFGEKTRMRNKCFAACNTVVTPITIALFAGPISIPEMIPITLEPDDSDDDDDEMNYQYVIDDKIGFTLPNSTATAVYDLRRTFSSMFVKLLNNPSPTFERNSTNEQIVQTISDILLEEEQQHKLRQPDNIGHRPVAVNLHHGNRRPMNFIQSNQPSTSRFNQSNRGIDQNWRQSNRNQRLIDQNWRQSIHPNQSVNQNWRSNSNVDQVQRLMAPFRPRPLTRYFVVHTNGRLADNQTHKWQYSSESWRTLERAANLTVKIIILFYYPLQRLFFAAAEFNVNGKLKFIGKLGSIHSDQREFNDCQELDSEIGCYIMNKLKGNASLFGIRR